MYIFYPWEQWKTPLQKLIRQWLLGLSLRVTCSGLSKIQFFTEQMMWRWWNGVLYLVFPRLIGKGSEWRVHFSGLSEVQNCFEIAAATVVAKVATNFEHLPYVRCSSKFTQLDLFHAQNSHMTYLVVFTFRRWEKGSSRRLCTLLMVMQPVSGRNQIKTWVFLTSQLKIGLWWLRGGESGCQCRRHGFYP